MDWFERLAGFREMDYEATRARLAVEGRELVSLVSGQRHGIGEFELASLSDLRRRLAESPGAIGSTRVEIVRADVRMLHELPKFNRALFQVASQFNALEMAGPSITPEDGVSRYAADGTQGPACAMAAGAATVYRTYFVPIAGERGQTRRRQLDGLADLGAALATALDCPVTDLWGMHNGYALCTADGLQAIDRHLATAGEEELDQLRGLLRIGLHWNVEVTDVPKPPRPVVSQAFCSALPVSYSDVSGAPWERFARLILDAAYEATLVAGALNARMGGSNIVLLTRLGGGAFGNDPRWIDDAMRWALQRMGDAAIDVRLVSFGSPTPAMLELDTSLRRLFGRHSSA
jgi:hypothetical protein